jgi:hypothetical protein
VTIGQGRDDMAMKKNVSHPGGLPSRTSNSSDCKWGHFCPPLLAIAAFQTKKGAKFKKI